MKLFHWAVASAAIASTLLPVLPAAADPDYPCHMKTASGRMINLGAICAGKPLSLETNQTTKLQTDNRQTKQKAANSGQVVETTREIKDSGSGSWTLSGTVQNQTQQTIRIVSIVLRVQIGSQLSLVYAPVSQPSVAPYGYVDFQTVVTAKDHHPGFHVDSVQWANEDATTGIYP